MYEYDRQNPYDFMHLRHHVNYDVSFLVEGFMEYLLPIEELEEFAERMQSDPMGVSLDQDEYLERERIGILRIKLLFELLNEILDGTRFRLLRAQLVSGRTDMLRKIKDTTCVTQNFSRWLETI
ncbi:MAG: hypothetical protein AAFN93_26815 [Bacteroidota bacterium]